ncbi:MAG: protein kinase [Polyangiaceae bacterium]
MSEDRFQPGQAFLHFRIIRLLGQGGMGAVYEAEHEFTQRRVALKVILTHRANTGDFRERMVQEARALADLSHPNIVTLFDANMAEDGTVWLATEYLQGQTLRELMRAYPTTMPVRDALTYLIETCDGVAAAHELGIIHRDLKPENIFITKQGGVKVLDFGAAKVRARGLVRSTDIVIGGGKRSVIGTPEYMSPEHLMGQSVDERTDIFALGNIGYELLHKHPHHNVDGSTPDMFGMCYRQLHNVPRPLSEAAPHLPKCLSAIFERALQKEPNARYQRVVDLAADLRSAWRQCAQSLPSGEHPAYSPRWVGPGSYKADGPKFTLPQHEPVPVPSKAVVVNGSAAGRAASAPSEGPAPVPSSATPSVTERMGAPAPKATELLSVASPAGHGRTTGPITVLRPDASRSRQDQRRVVWVTVLSSALVGALVAGALAWQRSPSRRALADNDAGVSVPVSPAGAGGPSAPETPSNDAGSNDAGSNDAGSNDAGPRESPAAEDRNDGGADSGVATGTQAPEPSKSLAATTKTAGRTTTAPGGASPSSRLGGEKGASATPAGLPFKAPKN